MPPIATSTSCSTLISLDANEKASFPPLTCYNDDDFVSPEELHATSIYLPSDDEYYQHQFEQQEQQLLLPAEDSRVSVDEYVCSVPSLSARTDELLSVAPRVFTRQSEESILNVCQGEVAHATSAQCDVIVSTDSTTCHIVALQSQCLASRSQPLTTLTHIDEPSYSSCLRKMVETHCAHYGLVKNCIEMDIHIMGGFRDDDGCSQQISDFLLRTFARIAAEFAGRIRLTLRTCAVTCANDTGFSAPIGRGLAIDTRTGETYLADVDSSAVGPAVELRSCRLWAGGGGGENTTKTLSLVHSAPSTIISSDNYNNTAPTTTTTSELIVQPFRYKAFRDVDSVIQLPDHILLQKCSTSPMCEADNFCDNLRRTLYFMKTVCCTRVFGSACCTPVTFRRVGRSNKWIKI